MQRRFTARDLDELVDAYEDGATINELATRFGAHRTTVMEHLHRHGVHSRSPRKLTDLQVAEAACRYRQGETLERIAREFSVAPSTVRRELKAAGVPIRPRGRRPAPSRLRRGEPQPP